MTLHRPLLVAMMVGLLASGCASAADGTSTPGAVGTVATSTDDKTAWADRVCDAMQPLTTLTTGPPRFNAADPADALHALTGYLTEMADRAGRAQRALGTVGPAPLDGGDQAAATVHDALGQLERSSRTARDKLAKLDPNQPLTMARQLPGILAELSQTATRLDLSRVADNPELDELLRTAPRCAQLMR